jgi:GGDEF domain-containing protein
VAIYPAHGDDPDSLRASADAALYAVKQAGRNAYRFAPISTR